MTDPTISTLVFIGLVFALAAAARILLRAALVLVLAAEALTGRAEAPVETLPQRPDLPLAA